MRQLSFTLLLLVSGAAFAGTMYKWVDENGTIHYSDRPEPGATELQIDTSPARSTPQPRVPTSGLTASAAAGADFRYASCAITRPANDETFQNAFSVSVGWQVSPGLRGGDRVTLALDGSVLAGVSPSATSFTIAPIDRGTHSLMVSIVDANGKGVCQSSATTFHVHQPSVQSPNRQPAPAPRPRPRPTPPKG